MINFSIDQVKSLFMDKDAVKARLTDAEKKVFGKIGKATRQTAKSSMKRAPKRLIKRLAEVNHGLRRARGEWRETLLKWRTSLRKEVHSRPGEAPFRLKGFLYKFLYFAFDVTAHTVVVGPIKLGAGTAPPTLETGGTVKFGDHSAAVAPRPYMGPAQEKQLPTIPALWRDAM